MNDEKLTILIDMDDTIEYLLREWLTYLNIKHGTNVTEDDIHDYNIGVAFPMLTLAEVYEPLLDHELWRNVKPIPGARYAIERMQNDGHDIYIVTSSNFATIATKLSSVLFKYFPTIDSDHVIIAHNKQMIRGDVLIDDAPHNLIGGDYLKIMPTAAHNRDFNEIEHNIIRVENWNQIYDIICDYWYLCDAVNNARPDAFVNTMTFDEACKLLGVTPNGFCKLFERFDSELAFMESDN